MERRTDRIQIAASPGVELEREDSSEDANVFGAAQRREPFRTPSMRPLDSASRLGARVVEQRERRQPSRAGNRVRRIRVSVKERAYAIARAEAVEDRFRRERGGERQRA